METFIESKKPSLLVSTYNPDLYYKHYQLSLNFKIKAQKQIPHMSWQGLVYFFKAYSKTLEMILNFINIFNFAQNCRNYSILQFQVNLFLT